MNYTVSLPAISILIEDSKNLISMRHLPGFNFFLENNSKNCGEYYKFSISGIDTYDLNTIQTHKLIYKFNIDYGECIIYNNGDSIIFTIYDQDLGTSSPSLVLHTSLKSEVDPVDHVYIDSILKPSYIKFSLWFSYSLKALIRHASPVHSSVIIKNNEAILFLGESGTGKSTQSRLWKEFDVEVFSLNDDSPIVFVRDKEIYVSGSPWSGKGKVYKKEEYKVNAFVRVVQKKENRAYLLSKVEAFSALYPSFPPSVHNFEEIEDSLIEIINLSIHNVKVVKLECLPEIGAVETLNNLLYGKI